MLYATSSRQNIGTLRECFVVNQLSYLHDIEYGKTQGDFVVDCKVILEVVGKDKTFKQIEGLADSYILADNMKLSDEKNYHCVSSGWNISSTMLHPHPEYHHVVHLLFIGAAPILERLFEDFLLFRHWLFVDFE